jgi:hypothetical protein
MVGRVSSRGRIRATALMKSMESAVEFVRWVDMCMKTAAPQPVIQAALPNVAIIVIETYSGRVPGV